MKFLCEQCKAKYQIADEKVAGKTVRMKCRKCGHLIEVRAEVTETSVAKELPKEPTAPGSALAPPRPPPRAAPQRATALAASLTSARPSVAKPDRLPGGALAGGFRTSVQREEEISAPFDMSELSPSDDWYVAINGVPVGPVQIAEVRRKAALGAVTEDSLVWQEGLDEWRPVRSFPDLAAIVRAAVVSGRTSLTPAPPEGRPSAPPPGRTSTRPLASSNQSAYRGVPRAAPFASTPAPRSNVVALTSRLATAERLDDAARDDAFAAPTPFVRPGGALRAGSVAPDPFLPVGDSLQGPALMAAPASAAAVQPQPSRRAIPWIPIAMVVMAAAFGITLALRPSQQAPAPVVVQVPVSPTPAPPPSVAAAPQASDALLPIPTATGASKGPAAIGPVAKTTPATTNTGRSLDLRGIGGSNVALSDDPTGGDAPKAPGQCISEGQILRVVQLHTVSVRRSCFERSQTTKPSVNVNVMLTVAADGSAQNVTASGDEPSVAKCIENDVRTWRFPAMGCAQKTAIPFKFVSQ
jgi:predicted Zn finger-like uncharacterized protein